MKRVLLDTRERHWDQNPYVRLLATFVGDDVQMIGFAWRRLVLGRYSVLHLHWPEYLLRHPRRSVRVAARTLMCIALVRIYVLKTPVIRTAHDLKPFVQTSRIDDALLKILDRRVVRYIILNPVPRDGDLFTERIFEPGMMTLISHPDYQPWLDKVCGEDWQPPRVDRAGFATVGILRRYKNVERSIHPFLSPSSEPFQLLVAGNAPDPEYLAELEASARDAERVTIRPQRVPDEEMVRIINSSIALIVPYEDLYNSGVIFLSLSLGCPVITPRNSVTEELQDEYGGELVFLFEDEVEGALLHEIHKVASGTRRRVRNSARSWETIGAKHAEVYLSA